MTRTIVGVAMMLAAASPAAARGGGHHGLFGGTPHGHPINAWMGSRRLRLR